MSNERKRKAVTPIEAIGAVSVLMVAHRPEFEGQTKADIEKFVAEKVGPGVSWNVIRRLMKSNAIQYRSCRGERSGPTKTSGSPTRKMATIMAKMAEAVGYDQADPTDVAILKAIAGGQDWRSVGQKSGTSESDNDKLFD